MDGLRTEITDNFIQNVGGYFVPSSFSVLGSGTVSVSGMVHVGYSSDIPKGTISLEMIPLG